MAIGCVVVVTVCSKTRQGDLVRKDQGSDSWGTSAARCNRAPSTPTLAQSSICADARDDRFMTQPHERSRYSVSPLVPTERTALARQPQLTIETKWVATDCLRWPVGCPQAVTSTVRGHKTGKAELGWRAGGHVGLPGLRCNESTGVNRHRQLLGGRATHPVRAGAFAQLLTQAAHYKGLKGR